MSRGGEAMLDTRPDDGGLILALEGTTPVRWPFIREEGAVVAFRREPVEDELLLPEDIIIDAAEADAQEAAELGN